MKKTVMILIAAGMLLLSGCAETAPEGKREASETAEAPIVSGEAETPEETPMPPAADEDGSAGNRTGRQPAARSPVSRRTPAREAEDDTPQEETAEAPEGTEEPAETGGEEAWTEPVPDRTVPEEDPETAEGSPAPEERTGEEGLEPSADPESPEETQAPGDPDAGEDPAPEESPEAEVDIWYWVGYAQSVAQGKGLVLDPEATGCWDNPILATPRSIYLDRDLDARMSYYAGWDEITSVWIWPESRGDGTWLIYIGYA